MGLERRGRAGQIDQRSTPVGEEPKERSRPKVKSFDIPKRLVYEAWEKVRANKGAPGVDAVSITEFADDERDNLYKLWNRMSSGSYLPGPVRAVEIPKDHGAGIRTLGVPNIADRVAQSAAAMLLEESDDIVAHCDTEEQAHHLRAAIADRLGPLGLELTPTRRRSCTAKTRTAKGRRSTPASTTSATPSGDAPLLAGTATS